MLNSISLNSYWRFITDENNKGLALGWNREIPRESGNILVPSCWNEWKEEMRNYDNIAWYFKEIVINKHKDIERNVLMFYGVNYSCDVWINAEFAGSHTGGFTPFEYDITRLIKFGEKNLIAVRVDSRLSKFTVPPMGVDWYNYGGIFRDVCLYGTGSDFFEDVTVVTRINGEISIQIENGNFSEESDYSLSIRVKDPELLTDVFFNEYKLNWNKTKIDLKISQPRLWSLDDPFLYDFELILIRNGVAADTWHHRIGLREFSIRDRQILINDKPVMLRGYSKHEEYPMLARTFSEEIVRKDYDILKQGNCNFVRMCHYPHHPKEYEIASENGIVAIAEVPNLNFTAELFLSDEVRYNSINQMKEMIKYYKNETCIMFWSLFIECFTDTDEAVDFVPSYVESVKQLDPTRLTIHASIQPVIDKTYDYFDVVGVNYWTGWYNGETVEEGSEILDLIASRYPDKPMIMTSGGWEAIPAFHAYRIEVMWSEESQADYLDRVTRMYQSKDYIVGEILWTFNDFRVMPWLDKGKSWYKGWWTQRPAEMNFKGVLDYYRRPKLAYYRLQETFKGWDDRLKKLTRSD